MTAALYAPSNEGHATSESEALHDGGSVEEER